MLWRHHQFNSAHGKKYEVMGTFKSYLYFGIWLQHVTSICYTQIILERLHYREYNSLL